MDKHEPEKYNLPDQAAIKAIPEKRIGKGEVQPLFIHYTFPLDIESFLHLAISICQVIESQHQQKTILHYISPHNLYIDSDGKNITFFPPEFDGLYSADTQAKTLAYISPEQTGRTNRQLDHRSDLYSLGITFYEMITGFLPYRASNSMEWVHNHIARVPLSPRHYNLNIPDILADIILKLMAKGAEERYQTVRGLKADLDKCLQMWQEAESIEPFELRQSDLSEQLLFPQKLYGRDQQKTILNNTFDRVYEGQNQILLVTGMAGIGKTSLIHEVSQAIAIRGGIFVTGKFEQYKKDIPFSAIIIALKELLRQLLMLEKQSLEIWKNRIIHALGSNAQVMIDVIPELELVIGPQASLPDLGPDETKNRFNLVFQNFIQVFTRAGHPLVIFIDDLQFADLSSLKLIETLLTGPESEYLLFIAAYRDNELVQYVPLLQIINDIKASQIYVITIKLEPLNAKDIQAMLIDMLACDHDKGLELAQIILKKTLGNPFFINQFIEKLYNDHILIFNRQLGCWEWDIGTILDMAATDNVIDLLLDKIKRLAGDVQHVLMLASCIGHSFDLKTLSIIAETSSLEIAKILSLAVAEGLLSQPRDLMLYLEQGITFNDQAYRFLHDRVQEAAYSLLGTKEREKVHLNIARLLLNNTPEESREDIVFSIVNHFNRGLEFVSEEPELLKIAHMNYLAGKKAKASTAYSQALVYLTMGTEILPADIWERDYPFAYEIFMEKAECEYLAGNHAKADQIFDYLLQQAQSNLDKAQVYNSRLRLYTSMGKFQEASLTGIEALRLFGYDLPAPHDMPALQITIREELEQYHFLMDGRQVEELINLPELNDLEKIVCANILVNMLSSAFVSNPPLLNYLGLKAVNYSLQHGISQHSTYTFAGWGLLLGAIYGDYKSGHAFGCLALQFNEKFNYAATRCNIPFLFGFYINHWRRPINESSKYLHDAFLVGIEMGDYVYASFTAHAIPRIMLAHGHDKLSDLITVINDTMSFFANTKNQASLERQDLIKHVVLNLMGLTQGLTSFSDDSFDEKAHFDHMHAIHYGTGIALYYYYKMLTLYTFEYFNEALEMAFYAVQNVPFLISSTDEADCVFYHSLCLAACYNTASPEVQQTSMDLLLKNQQRMQGWAQNCAYNYEHKYLLISAEIARLQEDFNTAGIYYEQALGLTQENQFIQQEAIAFELAGRFYKDRGFIRISNYYFKEARAAYLRWGAVAKVKQLDQKYPETRNPTNNPDLELINAQISRLDATTVAKAAQAISSEMFLPRLLETLMRMLIENAGAESGYLIIKNEAGLTIQASAKLEGDQTLIQLSPAIEISSAILPEGIIYYVSRTGEKVILADAYQSAQFASEDYIQRNRSKSILCLPIMRQAVMSGIIYLENKQITGAFTSDKLAVLELLSSQAAISLENASLYSALHESEQKYRTIFENSGTALIFVEEDMTISMCNKEFENLTGFSIEEIEGRKKWTDFAINSDDMSRMKENFRLRTIAPEMVDKTYDFQVTDRAGVKKNIMSSVSILPGTKIHLAALLDITQRKQAEEALKEVRDNLEIMVATRTQELHAMNEELTATLEQLTTMQVQLIQSEKMAALGNLVAGIAHEISTPVGVGVTVASALDRINQDFLVNYQRDNINSEEMAEYLSDCDTGVKLILGNLEKASRLIRSFKEVSVDQFSEVKRIFNVRQYLDEVLFSLQPLLKRTSHNISIICDENLVIDSYPGGFAQIITHLINNSLTHAYDDNQAGQIQIEVRKNHQQLLLLYGDDGKGMDKSVLSKVFDPFFTTKRGSGSIGLGLHVIYNIVTMQMGGTIECVSEAGQGTRFIICIPLEEN